MQSIANSFRQPAGAPASAGGQFAPSSRTDSGLALSADHRGTEQRMSDAAVLDRIALILGESEQWDADHFDDIAAAIQASGRPHPGDIDPDRYARDLHRWHVRQGDVAGTALDHVEDVAQEARLPVMGELLIWANDRDELPDDALSRLQPDDIVEMYETVVEPTIERVERDIAALRTDRAAVPVREVFPMAHKEGAPIMVHILGIVKSLQGPAADAVGSLTSAEIDELHVERVEPLAGCLTDWIRETPH